MVFLYIAVILVLGIGATGFFVWQKKKSEKNYQKLTENKNPAEMPASQAPQKDDPQLSAQAQKQPTATPELADPAFEDFKLDQTPAVEDKKENADKNLSAYERFLRQQLLDDDDDIDDDINNLTNNSENPFSSPFDDNPFDDDKPNSFNEINPLKENAHSSSLDNFDFDTLAGKTESEIKELIKDLPPKAQEIILTDILARKNWDDEN